MPYTVIIPARYASTRLPGKPLADIGGQPMIQHVWERAAQSNADRVIIATEDHRVADWAIRFGAQVCMTCPNHASGTDRLQEVVTQLGLSDDQIVVNVQGDEPCIPVAVIDQVAALLDGWPQAAVATLSHPITNADQLFDPNIVKVLCDAYGRALYFSRAPIPWDRERFATPKGRMAMACPSLYQRHLGIYAYRVGLLNKFVAWGESPLEQLERLEQLRVLWNGELICVAEACELPPAGVDTQTDLDRVRTIYATRRGVGL